MKKEAKKRGFHEPGIPAQLMIVNEEAGFRKAVEEQEAEITKRQFKGIFLTKFTADGRFFRQTIFKNCRFMGCTFDESEFTDVKFINCDFYNSSFNDTYFKDCSFQDSKAVEADFYGSRMSHVSFTDCCIVDAGFDAVRMSYIRARDTDFTKTSFSKCKITNADWKNVCFQQANFFKTILKGIDFSQCDISGIILSDKMEELKGMLVNSFQAIELAQRMGIVIRDREFNEND